MGRFDSSFPFVAVTGQEKLKEALILCAVNHRIGGVLVCGEKGTAKSTLARGLSHLLTNSSFVELPLNVTEDNLVGSIDLEKTIRSGKPEFLPGLLKAVDNGILYVDEVNLLSEQIVNILLEVSSSEINHVQREGIALSHNTSFVLIGSMNPEEGKIRGALLDRFGLFVETHGEKDILNRCKIVKDRISYEQNPTEFCKRWAKESEMLANRIKLAKQLVRRVSVPENCIRFASELSETGLCQGHRAELILCETAIAMAAFDGRYEVTIEDIRKSADFVLPHRIKEAIKLETEADDEVHVEENETTNSLLDEENRIITDDEMSLDAESIEKDKVNNFGDEDLNKSRVEPSSRNTDDNKDIERNADTREELQEIQPIEASVSLQILEEKKFVTLGSGKRLKVRNDINRGRYVRYRFPKGKISDIAVDATLRAAVLRSANKNVESGKNTIIDVSKIDLREKIREQRTGAVILFVVDSSGSMGARKRMGAVKGAVLTILNDAYQKRDVVGIVGFRRQSAEVLLPFTKSVDLAHKCFRNLSTGGSTPLAAGLKQAGDLLRGNFIKNRNVAQLMVLVSDGRANFGESENPFDEALNVARRLSAEPFSSVVLDTERGFARFGMAKSIADALKAEYCVLNEISETEIKAHIGKYLGYH